MHKHFIVSLSFNIGYIILRALRLSEVLRV